MTENIKSFPPIEPKQAKVLILGSIPGVQSLQQQQYYAHKQNAFWWIMAQILTTEIINATYLSKIEILKNNGIALWDTLASCQRIGSLDSNIKANSIIVNDIPKLLTRHPEIKLIACNGKKSAELFKRHIQHNISSSYTIKTLPSTSPAYANMRRDEKATHWHNALAPYIKAQ